ncbi:MAG: hypothetical protein LBC86_06285 [Oscillospiraceae bacterium]|jgi:hypothetical protein|nr:hypothetical protein [Oscillospiraceae bacterium]
MGIMFSLLKEHFIEVAFFAVLVAFIIGVNNIKKRWQRKVSAKDIGIYHDKFKKLLLKMEKVGFVEIKGVNSDMLNNLFVKNTFKSIVKTLDKIQLSNNTVSLFFLDKHYQTIAGAKPLTYSISRVIMKFKIENLPRNDGFFTIKNYYVNIKADGRYKKYTFLISEADEINFKAFIAFSNLLHLKKNIKNLSVNEINDVLTESNY